MWRFLQKLFLCVPLSRLKSDTVFCVCQSGWHFKKKKKEKKRVPVLQPVCLLGLAPDPCAMIKVKQLMYASDFLTMIHIMEE